MNTEEELKKKIQEQIQSQLAKNQNQQIYQQEAEKILKLISSRILEPGAYERLMNLRSVKPELTLRIETYLAQLYQAGQIQNRISEQDFIILLKKLSDAEKKDFNIKRK